MLLKQLFMDPRFLFWYTDRLRIIILMPDGQIKRHLIDLLYKYVHVPIDIIRSIGPQLAVQIFKDNFIKFIYKFLLNESKTNFSYLMKIIFL